MGAEGFAWTIMFFILPLCAVFYPVSTLPEFMQPIAWALPPTYVFEGMRALMFDNQFRADLMIQAFGINAAYLAVACFTFVKLLDSSRRVGSLMVIGE
jgi:ABC-2 type transport system permease protein